MQHIIGIDALELKQLNIKYINEINKYLPSDKKLTIDQKFVEKLNNKNITKTISIAEALKFRRQKQEDILEELVINSGYKIPKYPLIITSSFLTSGTKEANDYNKSLFEDFMNDPKKYLYEEIKKVFDIQAKDLYALKDDPLKNAQFYDLNFSTIENVSKIIEIIKNDPNINKDLKDAIPSMESLINIATYPKRLTQEYEREMLAFPKLSYDLAMILNNEYINDNKDLPTEVKDYILASTNKNNNISPNKYLHHIHRIMNKSKTKDIFEKSGRFITRILPFRLDEGHKNELVDIDNILYPSGAKMGIKMVSNPTSRIGVECITTDVKEKYVNLWKEKFEQERGYNRPFNIELIEKENQGGFFERLRGKTSNEYKAMILALKEFNDPKSKNYLNYDNLKEKAQAYINHKRSQGYGVTKNYSGTPKKRKELADAILSMEKIHNNIMHQIKNEFSPDIKVPAGEIKKQEVFESNDIIEVIIKKPNDNNNLKNNNKVMNNEIEEIDDDSPNLKIDEYINNSEV